MPGIGSNFGGATDAHGVQLLHVALFIAGESCAWRYAQSRLPPSSCELSMRNCIGHSGQGVCGER